MSVLQATWRLWEQSTSFQRPGKLSVSMATQCCASSSPSGSPGAQCVKFTSAYSMFKMGRSAIGRLLRDLLHRLLLLRWYLLCCSGPLQMHHRPQERIQRVPDPFLYHVWTTKFHFNSKCPSWASGILTGCVQDDLTPRMRRPHLRLWTGRRRARFRRRRPLRAPRGPGSGAPCSQRCSTCMPAWLSRAAPRSAQPRLEGRERG